MMDDPVYVHFVLWRENDKFDSLLFAASTCIGRIQPRMSTPHRMDWMDSAT